MTIAIQPSAAEHKLDAWSNGRSFEQLCAEFDEKGFLIFENVLNGAALQRQIDALEVWLAKDVRGRNNFEGADSTEFTECLLRILSLQI